MGRTRRLVAVLLSFLFPGLGHAYVRRFRRGLGFAAVAVGVVVLFGPSIPTSGPVFERALVAWESASFEANVALSAVEFAAMLDVYLLERSTDDPDTATRCPNCSRELDETLSFCPWCAHELPTK
jgi:TM2 domain-containing membrane protein YozV